jgi:hypothetical protein
MGLICTGLNHIGIIFTMVYFILIGIVWDTDMVDTDMVDTDMVLDFFNPVAFTEILT